MLEPAYLDKIDPRWRILRQAPNVGRFTDPFRYEIGAATHIDLPYLFSATFVFD